MGPVVRRDGLVRLARPSSSSSAALFRLAGTTSFQGCGKSLIPECGRRKMRTLLRVLTLTARQKGLAATLVTCTRKGDRQGAHWLGECALWCLLFSFPIAPVSQTRPASLVQQNELAESRNHHPLLVEVAVGEENSGSGLSSAS